MALFLGALEYVLEDGPRYDWFEDPTIATRGGGFGQLGGDLFRPRADGADSRSSICGPLPTAISRSAACSRSCSASGLYGLTYLYPVYLGEIRGFNALMIGKTMFVSGVTMFLPRRSSAG